MSAAREQVSSSRSLRELRDPGVVDQTLQNLLRALTLNLELCSRYRVFQFEASQDGHREVAELFSDLREAEEKLIGGLLDGLRLRLGPASLVEGRDHPDA